MKTPSLIYSVGIGLPTRLVAWRQALEGRRAWWREHGADYLFVITPNKSTIYPEKLPDHIRGRVRPGKLDQLIDDLRKEKCPVPILDLRATLLAAKSQNAQPIYWPTDSHWSAEGLVLGCNAIMQALQQMRVPLRARDEGNWMQGQRALREGDCVALLTMSGRWPLEPITQLRLAAPPDARVAPTGIAGWPVWKSVSSWAQPMAFERDSGVGRTVMLCDSFFRAGGMAPDTQGQIPLLLNFRRFVSIWPWYGKANFANYEVCSGLAEVERPTLVIEQWTERSLRTAPPDHPEFQRARNATLQPH